ncbi:MAG: hypothetical protein COA41_09475 [Sphingopyxis sp.]|nr:MAG: hypothetical protein COA41_09475 [Sphingopyxis sp.]
MPSRGSSEASVVLADPHVGALTPDAFAYVFLLLGDKFSKDQIDAYAKLKSEEVSRWGVTPKPVEFDYTIQADCFDSIANK